MKMDRSNSTSPEVQWAKNVILADADYLDALVFDVSVQLERMLERPLPKLDLARWADYVALDGGLRPGDNQVQLLLIHSKKKNILKNVLPANLTTEIDGQAFRDNLGEFSLSAFPVEETMVTPGQLFAQSVEALLAGERVERLMLVGDVAAYGDELAAVLKDTGQKQVTVFTLQTVSGMHCPQEMLTYSLLAALGVSSDEVK